MEQHNYNKQHTLNDLISEYEAMSQKKAVVYYEETVFSNLIEYYQKEKNYDLALSLVEMALIQHSFSARLYYKKAELLFLYYQDTPFMEDALNALAEAEKLSPRDLDIILLKVELLGRSGSHFEAFSLLSNLKKELYLSTPHQLADIYYLEGILYEGLKDYDAMFKVWRKALLLNTRHTRILNKIWLCVEWGNKHQESIFLFEEIIDENPYCHLAWFYLGNAFVYFGRYKEAVEAYEYAFIIDNQFEWAYKECAAICLVLKDYAKALECYEEALKFVLADADLLFDIGQCYQLLGNLTVALDFYDKALDIEDYNDEIFYAIGQCMLRQEKFLDAIFYFRKAIELDGRREEYFASLGETYYQLNCYQEIRDNFTIATELAPEQADIWLQYATILFRLGDIKEALLILDDAELHSVGEELLYCRVACLESLGRHKEAIDVLAEAMQEDPAKHKILYDYIPNLASKSSYLVVIDYFMGE